MVTPQKGSFRHPSLGFFGKGSLKEGSLKEPLEVISIIYQITPLGFFK